jgi:hypothetical protein
MLTYQSTNQTLKKETETKQITLTASTYVKVEKKKKKKKQQRQQHHHQTVTIICKEIEAKQKPKDTTAKLHLKSSKKYSQLFHFFHYLLQLI